MSLLFRVIYAAHAPGTHHKLALDGLTLLHMAEAEGWRRLLLKNVEPFMRGAKDPDNTFKDFKNHVLHPRDGYWGGAPGKCREWYDRLVTELRNEAWHDAAYAAGVLSHYVTDPVHPFHTAQSEAENAIHRAFEWSTAKSYDAAKSAAGSDPTTFPPIPEQADWVEEMVRQAAKRSNRQYEKLIAHYDIHRGVVDPPAGLDSVALRTIGTLIKEASALFACILQCAIVESGARPAPVSLTLDTVLATITIPIKRLLKRMEDRQDRKQIERMYDELVSTGTVEHNLPEDDRMVRDLHRTEVLGRPKPQPEPVIAPPVRAAVGRTAIEQLQPSVPVVPSTPQPARLGARLEAASTAKARHEPEPARETPPEPRHAPGPRLTTHADLEPSPEQKSWFTTTTTRSTDASADDDTPDTPVVPFRTPAARESMDRVTRDGEPLERERSTSGTSERHPRLSPGDPVVDAPSIGPRTAERLEPLGILTVADLLAAEPEGIARRIDARHIDAKTIADWQCQARLVCSVPGLTGTGAQLFVGAGYRDLAQLADADTETLCADVLRYATSTAGQRLLRNGEPPDVSRIKQWVEDARSAAAA